MYEYFLNGILFANLIHPHPNVLSMSKEQVRKQAFKQESTDSGAVGSAEQRPLCG